jgi:oligoendopeptidase F
MAAGFSSSTAAARMTVEGTPAWDLATLMPDGAVGASASGGRAVVMAQAFADEHRGRIGGYDAAALARLWADLERVQEALTVSYAYSMLRLDADTPPPEHGVALAESKEMTARVETIVTFAELEWIALDDARADELLADPALGRFAHWLHGVRRRRPYRRSEAAERILPDKTVAVAGSWRRLLDAQVTALGLAEDPAIRVELIGRNLDEAQDPATAMAA